MAKSRKTFEVTLRIADDKVETIMGLVAGECTLVGMKEVLGAEPVRNHSYANGVKNKGISGERLLLGVLRLGPATARQIMPAFEKAGFRSASASPSISNAIKNGLVTRDAEGVVSITDAGQKRYEEGGS